MKEGNSWDGFWDRQWLVSWKSGKLGVTPTVKSLFQTFKRMGLSKSARILDAGCGSATLAQFWLQQGYVDIIGLDISNRALEIAHQKGISCLKSDIAKGLPFRDNTFDLVYSDGLLEHFSHPEPLLDELFRVSKRYVLTIVPRETFINNILTSITKPPKEFKRNDSEWLELHRAFKPLSIKSRKSMFLNLIILCEVDEVG